MDLGIWINFIYGVVTLIIMFTLVPMERIKRLWPVGIIAVVILFVAEQILFSLELLRFNNGLLMIWGIPVFQYLWAFAAGIIVINYMEKDWIKKLPLLLLFATINEVLVFVAWSLNNLSFMNGFGFFYDFIATFVGFSFAVWVAEGMFKNRIYGGSGTALDD